MVKLRGSKPQGFTLIELMIVVAVIGILAAVAVPVLSGYIRRSKAAESATVLQGIREKQEAYFGEYRRYTQPMRIADGNQKWNNGNCGDCMNNTTDWTMDDGQPHTLMWLQLGFDPGGQTYYVYEVDTPYSAAGVFNGAPGLRQANVGTRWTATVKPWFLVRACGDLDCDGNVARFYVSSENKTMYHDGQDGEIY